MRKAQAFLNFYWWWSLCVITNWEHTAQVHTYIMYILFNRHKSVDPHLYERNSWHLFRQHNFVVIFFSELYVEPVFISIYLIASNYNDFHLNFCHTHTPNGDLFDPLCRFIWFEWPYSRTLFNYIIALAAHTFSEKGKKHPLANHCSISNSILISFCNCFNSMRLCTIELTLRLLLVLSKKISKGDDLLQVLSRSS